jgi:glucan biosynthesis protein C
LIFEDYSWESTFAAIFVQVGSSAASALIHGRKNMTAIELQPRAREQVKAEAAKTSRLYFIDHLRSFLIILVVLHHVALVYGASLEGYYYVEPPFTSPSAFAALLVFTIFNQSWFMGAFFLLAGYFTPGSYQRKGLGSFIKDRLLRLGIPLVLFYFVLSPLSFIGYFLMPAELTGITTPFTWQSFWGAYPKFLGMGPLWFVAMLLVFDIGYALLRLLTGNENRSSRKKSFSPGYLGLGLFTLALALLSYLWRMVVPLDKSVLQFPSLAYLPQYLSFFIIGAVASRDKWFEKIPGSMSLVGFAFAVLAGVFLFPLAFSGQLFSLELTPAFYNAMGNGHWQSGVYALWDSIFAVGMSVGLLPLFRNLMNGSGWLGRFLSRQSYAVYIIHIPIIVFAAYAFRNVAAGSLLKFGLLSLIVVPFCFIVAGIVRKIPYVSRII